MTEPTNWRALCAELTKKIDYTWGDIPEDVHELLDRARASLAQSIPEEPSDEELTLTYAYAVAAAVGNKRGPFKKEDAEAAQLAGLRAVLARYAFPTPPSVA
jgi:hypothetical protein